MLKDTQINFGKISIFNHWLLALLMIGMLAFGLFLEEMPRGGNKQMLMGWHKSIGIVILFLGLWRVGWRLVQKFPDHVAGVKNWEKTLARIAHIILLAGILLMPISGYLKSTANGKSFSFFGWFDIGPLVVSQTLKSLGNDVHGVLAKILIVILLLHVAAALKHHFVNKDMTLKRMLGE